MANDLSADVADRLGISPITVRRRARKAISALADACAAHDNAA
jgi:predicted DNA binding protein